MPLDDKISKLVTNFKPNLIQSEAEVSTKFIIPLLDCLGYSSNIRSEEFPIYGHSGGKKERPKPADFILFSSSSFASHRRDNEQDKKWVQDHSLLVVEAKNIGKLAKTPGQAQYYTMWSKALAYIETDGVDIYGYIHSTTNADPKILDTKVCNLHQNQFLDLFTYEVLMKLKSAETSNIHALLEIIDKSTNGECRIENVEPSSELIDFMKCCLGKNAINLDSDAIFNTFTSTTNMILENNLRYDIPEYLLNFQRNIYPAQLYLDNNCYPSSSGHIQHSYWEDIDRYFYTTNFMQIYIEYKKCKVIDFKICYHIIDNSVDSRLKNFELLEKCFKSKNMIFKLDNPENKIITVTPSRYKTAWKDKDETFELLSFWHDSIKKLKYIETHYNITFLLKPITIHEDIISQYKVIDYIYNGIELKQNAEFIFQGNIFGNDCNIDEPILLERNFDMPLDNLQLFNHCFRPKEITIIPCNLANNYKISTDTLHLPISCIYSLLN